MYSVENKVCLKHFTIYNTSAALNAFHQAFFISFLNVGHIVAAPWGSRHAEDDSSGGKSCNYITVPYDCFQIWEGHPMPLAVAWKVFPNI